MFARVEICTSDLAASQRFYTAVLAALPLAVTQTDEGGRAVAWGDFALAQARAGQPATQGLHVGFAAPSRAAVGAFWEAGDPDGNHVELVRPAPPVRGAP